VSRVVVRDHFRSQPVRFGAPQYRQVTDVVWLAVITGVACLLFAALFSGDPLITHEGLETYFRTHQYLEEFGNGHWVPQLLPDAVRGAGAAFPTFYPPFAYLVAALLAFVSRDVVRGVNLALLLSVILSGWAMYFMVVVIGRNRVVAAAAAMLYLSFPYRFVDVFVRGALAESWSFVWFPLIVAGTWRVLTERRLHWLLPVSWAGLLLTHVPTALYFVFPYAALLGFGLWRGGWRPGAVLVGAFALGLGLAAWFIAPQQAMLRDVRASDATTFHADDDFVHRARVHGHQVLGTWRNGWRGPDHDLILEDGRRCPRFYCLHSFVLGTGHVVMLVLVAAVAVAVLGAAARHRPLDAAQRAPLLASAAFLMTYGVSIAFMVTPRTFLRVLPGSYGYIQYPWRLLAMVAFLATAIVALLLSSGLLGRHIALLVLAISAVIVFTVPSVQRSPAFERGVDHDDLEALVPTKGDRGFTAVGEYLPREVDADNIEPYLIDEPQVQGDGRVLRWARNDGDLDAELVLRDDSVVVFPLLYYDVYRVTAPGRGRLQTFSADGLLAARAPAGTKSVRVTHGLTAVGWLGLATTSLSAFVLAATTLRRHRRVRGERTPEEPERPEPVIALRP
jgi:hypothetical protein